MTPAHLDLLTAPAAHAAASPSAGSGRSSHATGNSLSEQEFLKRLAADLGAGKGQGKALAREILAALGGAGATLPEGGPAAAAGRGGTRDGKTLPHGIALPGGAELLALLQRLAPTRRAGGSAPDAGGAARGPATVAAHPAGAGGGGRADVLTRLLQVLEAAHRDADTPPAGVAADGGSGTKAAAARLAALLHAAGTSPPVQDARAARLLLAAAQHAPAATTTSPGDPAASAAPAHPAGAEGAPAPLPTAPVAVGGIAPAGAAAASPAAAHAPPPLPVPPGHPAWGEALGSRVLWVLDHQLPSASVRLNPPGLGPLEIQVSLHQDQAQVSFASHHAVVRDAVEAALPRLRELFAGNGLTLAGVHISQHSLADRGAGDSPGQMPQSQSQPRAVAPVRPVHGGGGVAEPVAAVAAVLGLVDYYA